MPMLTRRNFLAVCPGAALCAHCTAGRASAQSLIPSRKTRIRLVFTHQKPEIEGWPYKNYDFEGRKKELTARLRASCPNVEFFPVWAKDEADAKQVLAGDAEVDGYLVYLLGIPSNASRFICAANRPTVVVDDLYGGTGQFLGTWPEARAKGWRVAGVTSSRFEDVVEAVKGIECVAKLKESTILVTLGRDLGEGGKPFEETMGVKIRGLSAEQLDSAYRKADRTEARRSAKEWMAQAEKIVEPSTAELEKSGAMYVGMRNLMQEYKAQGMAIDCLRLFYGGKMSAYPCMGFFQLNNDGLVGACEADLQSAATMLLITYLTGRPGYISDPVIDTSKNQIIYAHCVAPSKVYGPGGKSNAYHIRDHSEDRKGAAVRSLMPIGDMTTSLKFVPQQKVMVIHTSKAVANLDEDKACRTKLAAEPKDARKLAAGWAYGWHRVTVYGDYRVQLENAASLLGFKTVEEG